MDSSVRTVVIRGNFTIRGLGKNWTISLKKVGHVEYYQRYMYDVVVYE